MPSLASVQVLKIVTLNVTKNRTVWLYNAVKRPKEADELGNSEDPDQQSDLGLNYLLVLSVPVLRTVEL